MWCKRWHRTKDDDSGKWKITMESLERADEVLGRDVLTAFCCCFVHADRLNSTMSCMDASANRHGDDSIAYARDLNAMVWFSVGTLRELARSIQSLRCALEERGLLDPESPPWVTLRALEDRWEFYKTDCGDCGRGCNGQRGRGREECQESLDFGLPGAP